jgi:UDP-N-acetylmuramoyl-tripeptide--D-alanyl-D-alanine ligase
MVGLAHAGGFGGIEATLKREDRARPGDPPGRGRRAQRDDARVSARWPTSRHPDVAVRWFGRGPGAEVRAEDVEVTAAGTTCTSWCATERAPDARCASSASTTS